MRLVEFALAQPVTSSGTTLRLLLESDETLRVVRQRLSQALENALTRPSEDSTSEILEVFAKSSETLERRRRNGGPGAVEWTSSGLAMGGVLLDLALLRSVAPSVILGALAAQLPLMHSLHLRSQGTNEARGAQAVLLGLARPVELDVRIAALACEPMSASVLRHLASRLLADHVAMTAAALGALITARQPVGEPVR